MFSAMFSFSSLCFRSLSATFFRFFLVFLGSSGVGGEGNNEVELSMEAEEESSRGLQYFLCSFQSYVEAELVRTFLCMERRMRSATHDPLTLLATIRRLILFRTRPGTPLQPHLGRSSHWTSILRAPICVRLHSLLCLPTFVRLMAYLFSPID